EDVLNKCCSIGFSHSEQSVRIVERIEKNGEGLNLTWEVIDGIRNHQTEGKPATPEGKIVRISDKIAYVSSDIDDAIRGKILTEDDIPKEIRNTLGFSVRERLDTMVHDVVTNSMDSPDIKMSEEVHEAMIELRRFLFKHVYRNPEAKGEEVKAKRMIKMIYEYYTGHFDAIPEKFVHEVMDEGDSEERIIADYIAGMTDSYLCQKFSEYFVPEAWEVNRY
ncbi:MAG: deoxyguanosinetriphosphate triphosphohydrolase, partial [Lachnospiraceae bacterium]|nr:deoxyguanosinetriphosphate triphosphohydrolase [Lachnospiraceae bacterium]